MCWGRKGIGGENPISIGGTTDASQRRARLAGPAVETERKIGADATTGCLIEAKAVARTQLPHGHLEDRAPLRRRAGDRAFAGSPERRFLGRADVRNGPIIP